MKYIWYSPQKSKYPLYIYINLETKTVALMTCFRSFTGPVWLPDSKAIMSLPANEEHKT